MSVKGEEGFTLIELLVGAMISLVLLGAILAMTEVATRSQDRTADRVNANQRGRPTMTLLIDRLHAACVSPGLAPVREGSTSETLILYSKSGSEVLPTPDKYSVSLTGGALTETRFEGQGNSPTTWTFPAADSAVTLLDGVAAPAPGEPVFRYFAYEGGQVASEPLETPLNADRAARTVRVDISFAVAPDSTTNDEGAPVVLTDSATLRIEPASEDSAKVNLPCV